MTCKFKDRCWRYWYTEYLEVYKEYPSGFPPERMTLALMGFATEEMTKPKANGHLSGMWCTTLPQPNDRSTWCPSKTGISPQDCHEYKREEKAVAKAERAKQSWEKKFPNSIKFTNIDKVTRREVSERDKWACIYCLRHISVIKAAGHRASIDHKVSRAMGGGNHIDNLCFCCSWCNSRKQDKVWDPGCMEGQV